MSVHRRRMWVYLLVLGAALVFSAGYAVRRDFYGRYCVFQESRESVQAADEQARALEATVAQSQRRAIDLGNNALELEATIRQVKGRVRKNEKVFRIEAHAEPRVADAEPPVTEAEPRVTEAEPRVTEAHPNEAAPAGATIGLRGKAEPGNTTE